MTRKSTAPKSRRKRQSEEAAKLGRKAQKNESEVQDNEATTSSAIPPTSTAHAVIEDTEIAPAVSFKIVSETPVSSESVREPHDIMSLQKAGSIH